MQQQQQIQNVDNVKKTVIQIFVKISKKKFRISISYLKKLINKRKKIMRCIM